MNINTEVAHFVARCATGGGHIQRRRKSKVLLPRFLAILMLLTAISATARADCAFTPTNDVPQDVELGAPLLYGAYGGDLGVQFIFWDDDWDADPTNFRKADIESAMNAILRTPYSDRLCQYGVNGFHFEGSVEASSLCGRDPGSETSTPSLFSFMACEEFFSQFFIDPFFLIDEGTGVPHAIGAPNPLTCTGSCAGLPVDCFQLAEPLTTAACLATPNPTGSRVYVLFLPKGTIINDFGRESCSDYQAWHFQIPSRLLLYPPPFVPLTQGRPINTAIIPTECATDLADLMRLVTHELVEAATDPLPLAHWIDYSTATTSGDFDFTQIGTMLTEGEISDLCGDSSTTFTTTGGLNISVADYWSNHDNACVSLDVTPPTTTATLNPSSASGWANTDVSVTLAATDEPAGSGVAEIAFSATGAQSIAETHAPGTSAEVVFTVEGESDLNFFATDNAGNAESPNSATIRIDKTAPNIVASAAPPANSAGWNRTDVTISFACSDALSGVSVCTAPIVLSTEGTGLSASGNVTDLAGNENTTLLTGIAIDKTPPTITYTGNAETYTVDLMIDISCRASDALSGVATDTCADLHEAAWSLGLGDHTLNAEATDVADNVGSGSTTFEILVTEGSLCNLSRMFSIGTGVANGLCATLDAMNGAPTPMAREGARTAYLNLVSAQTGHSLSPEEAAVLTNLANAL